MSGLDFGMKLPFSFGVRSWRPLPPALTAALLWIAVVITVSPACTRHPDPDSVFDHAWETFQNGDLIGAQGEVDKAYQQFHSLNRDWAWKFNILGARILYRRGLYEEALKRIASETAAPPQCELAIKKLWLQGLLYTSLHNFEQAEQDLANAERLCIGVKYFTCEDVATARGFLEMERGHYAEAQVFFAKVLTVARSSNDEVGEASALLDLSHAAE